MTEAVPVQFVTDDAESTYVTQEPMSNGYTTEQPYVDAETPTQTETSTTGRRGRPRSQDAIDRDQRVYDALGNEQQRTRNEIAEEVGFKGGLVYLSLYRLKHDGLVKRVSDGTTRRAWKQTSAEERERYLVAKAAESEQSAAEDVSEPTHVEI